MKTLFLYNISYIISILAFKRLIQWYHSKATSLIIKVGHFVALSLQLLLYWEEHLTFDSNQLTRVTVPGIWYSGDKTWKSIKANKKREKRGQSVSRGERTEHRYQTRVLKEGVKQIVFPVLTRSQNFWFQWWISTQNIFKT